MLFLYVRLKQVHLRAFVPVSYADGWNGLRGCWGSTGEAGRPGAPAPFQPLLPARGWPMGSPFPQPLWVLFGPFASLPLSDGSSFQPWPAPGRGEGRGLIQSFYLALCLIKTTTNGTV